jgi:hypothetical protein
VNVQPDSYRRRLEPTTNRTPSPVGLRLHPV